MGIPEGKEGGEKLATARAAGWAKEAAERAKNSAVALLQRHTDLLGPDIIALIADREYDTGLEEAVRARSEGHANDNRSMAPGITILLTRAGYEGMSLSAIEKGAARPYLSEYVDSVQPANEEGTTFSLRLPLGTYSMGLGGCQIYGEVDFVDGRETDQRNPFGLSYDGIVRIEGDSGELWQNKHLTAEGQPKA